MAKKTSKRGGAGASGAGAPPKRLVKVWLSEDELRQVRVAAAVQNQRPSEFVRAAVLAEADRVQQRYLLERSAAAAEE